MISVIVPVFRVESFLDECILSILRQKETDIEVILVDDGSPDRSNIICDYYAELDSRVKVIHKEQGGPSDARNVGIEASKGEYLAFVDSDDFIAEDMLSSMLAEIKENDADIAICGHIWTNEGGKPMYPPRYKRKKHFIMDSQEATKKMMDFIGYESFVWNKMFKRELFSGIRFPKACLYEDLFTTYKLFAKAECIVYSKTVKYFYRQRRGSIIHGMNSKKCTDYLTATAELKNFVKKEYPPILLKMNLFQFRARLTYLFFCMIGIVMRILDKIAFQKRAEHWMKKTVFFLRKITPVKKEEETEIYENNT